MPTTYIYVFKWFKVSRKTRKTSEVCKKPVLQNKTGGCLNLLLGSSRKFILFSVLGHFSPPYITKSTSEKNLYDEKVFIAFLP